MSRLKIRLVFVGLILLFVLAFESPLMKNAVLGKNDCLIDCQQAYRECLQKDTSKTGYGSCANSCVSLFETQ